MNVFVEKTLKNGLVIRAFLGNRKQAYACLDFMGMTLAPVMS